MGTELWSGIAVISVVIVIFAILALRVYLKRRKTRNRQGVGMLGEEGLSRVYSESTPLLDLNLTMWSPPLLQPPRQKSVAVQGGLVPEHTEGSSRQLIFTPAGPRLDAPAPDPVMDNDIRFTRRAPPALTETGSRTQAFNATARLPPPRLSIIIPGTNYQNQSFPARPDPMYYTPPPAYQPILNLTGDRTTRPPMRTPRSALARPTSGLIHCHFPSRRTLIPYPGSAQSPSPPSYLSSLGRISGQSSHETSNNASDIFDATYSTGRPGEQSRSREFW